MIRLLLWGLYILAATFAIHMVSLAAIPYGVMKIALGRLEADNRSANTINHSERATHLSRWVVRPSPDLLYSICTYDLTQGPLRVVSGLPKDTYWSVSFYRDNTDNFYVANDGSSNGTAADIVLYGPGQSAPSVAGGQVAVQSPSMRGVVLFRTLVNSEERRAEIDAQRREASCAPLRP